MAEERLQKILAAAGVASRRASEELILAGRVQVNGTTVTELGTKVDPNIVQISVDGKPVHQAKRFAYYKLHKPRGILSDIGGDTRGRDTVAALLPPGAGRVFPVGRLDLRSEGLVLLTDDGNLAHKLTHPRYEHPKTYFVLVENVPGELALETLRKGVDLPEGRTAPARVRVVHRLPRGLKLGPGPTEGVWLEVELHEGKKRQIRQMTAAVGHPTLRLVRWSIGSLTLEGLAYGESAPLTRSEVGALRELTLRPKTPPQPKAPSPRPKTAQGRSTRFRRPTRKGARRD